MSSDANREVLDALEKDGSVTVVDIHSKRTQKALVSLGIFFAGFLFAMLIWWLVSWGYNTYMMEKMSSGLKFPNPADTLSELWRLLCIEDTILTRSIYEHTVESLSRWAKGFSIAFVIGVILGIILSLNNNLYRFGIVPVSLLQMIPGMAWFPVTILLFGFGNISAVYIIAIPVIAPITINVCNGLRRVPTVNMRVAKMCGRSKLETYIEMMIPFALLDILAGLRIGMANGWRVLVAAEMVVGLSIGVGYSIKFESAQLEYEIAFSCILIICIVGIIIDKVILASLEHYARKRMGFEE